MIRTEKQKTVDDLKKIFAESKGVYLADFTGINVEAISGLRREFRKANVNYKVVKNTLAKLSIKDMSLDELDEYFIGPTAIAYSSEDELSAGKIIEKFHKATKTLVIKASVIDGEVFNEEDTSKIIKLPPKDMLLAQLLGTLNSPITGFVRVLNGVIRNAVSVLDALREKMEKEGGALPQAEKTEEPAEAKAETVVEEPAEVEKEAAEEKKEDVEAVPAAEDKPEEKAEGKSDEPEEGEKEEAGE